VLCCSVSQLIATSNVLTSYIKKQGAWESILELNLFIIWCYTTYTQLCSRKKKVLVGGCVQTAEQRILVLRSISASYPFAHGHICIPRSMRVFPSWTEHERNVSLERKCRYQFTLVTSDDNLRPSFGENAVQCWNFFVGQSSEHLPREPQRKIVHSFARKFSLPPLFALSSYPCDLPIITLCWKNSH